MSKAKKEKKPHYRLGYRKPTEDDVGKKWCACTIPDLTHAGDGIHQAKCRKCQQFWYN